VPQLEEQGLKWNLLDLKLKTLISRDLTKRTRHSASIHLLSWQFTMIRLTPSKSLLWSSRPLNDMQVFANRRGTFPLQPHFDEIKRSHPNSSIEVPKILSLISYHSIFRFWTDRVGTFKWVNIEPQTFLMCEGGLFFSWPCMFISVLYQRFIKNYNTLVQIISQKKNRFHVWSNM